MAKVSIIVPVYNIIEYLPGAVGSLLRQTEKEIEIILVDDGSTDGSGALCDQYAGDDERIKVLHQENGGPSSARNAGVSAATSDYVLFLDGDDYLCDDAIETLIAAENRYHPDIVQFLYTETEKVGQHKHHDAERWSTFVETSPREQFYHLYRLGGVAASGCTKLIRRQLLVDHPFERIRYEDEMWCTRVFPTGVTIAYISDILYFYVMRKDSFIHSGFIPNRLDVFIAQEKRIKTLSALELWDLVEREYAKMFISVLTLYKEASDKADSLSCMAISEQFKKNKKALLKDSYIKGKHRILLRLMAIRFSFINLYLWFKAIQQSKAR